MMLCLSDRAAIGDIIIGPLRIDRLVYGCYLTKKIASVQPGILAVTAICEDFKRVLSVLIVISLQYVDRDIFFPGLIGGVLGGGRGDSGAWVKSP